MKLKADYFTSCNPAVLAKDSEPLCRAHLYLVCHLGPLPLAGGVLLSFILIFELCKATIKIKKKFLKTLVLKHF